MNVKTLKAMLRALRESGVAKYSDSEISVEFSNPQSNLTRPTTPFSIEKYDEEKVNALDAERDDLGMTEEDYLNWSAAR